MTTRTIDEEIAAYRNGGEKRRLLLHVCCAPCLCGVIEELRESFDLTVYFYNPNILPEEEFIKRFDAVKDLLASFPGIRLVSPDYDPDYFLTPVQGLESLPEGGERCRICFGLRLDSTAAYLAAHRDEYDYFTTTLTVSPHKNAPIINYVGCAAAEKAGVVYLTSDFKKKDGFLKSIKLSKQLNLYRQSYCGCNMGSGERRHNPPAL